MTFPSGLGHSFMNYNMAMLSYIMTRIWENERKCFVEWISGHDPIKNELKIILEIILY